MSLPRDPALETTYMASSLGNGALLPTQGALLAVVARLAAVEARQRAAGVHDPGCPWCDRHTYNTELGVTVSDPWRGTGPKPPCDCWLSRDEP